MSYVMNHHVCHGIAIFELSGMKTADAALEIWSTLQALIEKGKLDRLVVIDDMADDLTVWDFVDIEASLAASCFPRGVHMAIVDQALRQERNSNAFGELYLRNRGWYRIRMFESRDLALAWLRGAQGRQHAKKSPGDFQ